MARTNHDAVKDILGGNYGKMHDGCYPSLKAYIDTASSLINKVVACAARKGVPVNAVDQEIMERWMAAYYYTQMDPLYKSRTTGGGSGSFVEQDYSKPALQLDSSGCLGGLLKGLRAGIGWLGKTESEALSYEERNG